MPTSYSESLVIIPTYNEIDNIDTMIRTVLGLYPDLSLLIIEDNSPDGTGERVKSLQHEFPRLHLIQRQAKLGLGTAYVEGFNWALKRDFQYICEMDCDFSHDPSSLSDLLGSAKSCDLAIGSRYINGIRVMNWPIRKLLLSYMTSLGIRFLTGLPVHDTTSGFKCFSRKALMDINLNKIISKGYAFQIELSYKAWSRGLKIKEVPIIFYERKRGRSKMSQSIALETIITIIKLRFRKTLGQL